MFCSKCGKQLPDDSQFCSSCGYKIGTQVVVNEPTQVVNQQTSGLLMSATGKDCPKIFQIQLKLLGWIALVLIILLFLFHFRNRILIFFIIFISFATYKDISQFFKTLKMKKTFINVYNDHVEGIAIKKSSLVYFNLTYKQIVNTGADINTNELKIRTEDLLYICYAKNPYEIEELIISKCENNNTKDDY